MLFLGKPAVDFRRTLRHSHGRIDGQRRDLVPGLNQTPYRVIRQHWYNSDKGATLYTDQMPVVVRLNGSDRLAAALESSVSCVNDKTTHTISFAYSDNEGQWPRLEGDETGPADRQSNLFDGSAPFLVQFPSGETLLSYGASSHMNMRLGDAEARTFGEPFVALPGRVRGAAWS